MITVTDLVGFAKLMLTNNPTDILAGKTGERAKKDAKERSGSTNIKRMSKDLIAVFPILCSENMSPETMVLISNAIEYENANLLSLLVKNVANANGTTDTSEFLKQFHQNISRSYYEENFKQSAKYLLKEINELVNMNTLNSLTLPKYFNEDSDYDKKMNQKLDNPGYTKDEKELEDVQTKDVNLYQTEVKKYNDLAPIMLKASVKWLYKGVRNDQVIDRDLVFGIKANVHIIKNKDIITNLGNTTRDASKFSKLIRWTTGELKLWRDIILCTEYNKKLAKQAFDDKSYWFWKLRKISQDSKHRKYKDVALNALNSNDNKDFKKTINIATMAITKENVNQIENEFGFNLLENTKITKKIMDNYALLNFVVVDEAAEMAMLFDEATATFVSYPFSTIKIKRESKLSASDLMALFKR